MSYNEDDEREKARLLGLIVNGQPAHTSGSAETQTWLNNARDTFGPPPTPPPASAWSPPPSYDYPPPPASAPAQAPAAPAYGDYASGAPPVRPRAAASAAYQSPAPARGSVVGWVFRRLAFVTVVGGAGAGVAVVQMPREQLQQIGPGLKAAATLAKDAVRGLGK